MSSIYKDVPEELTERVEAILHDPSFRHYAEF